jgi:tRNA threonylcarbamoyladenosine biosynthesis protein TsaE
MNLTIDGEAGMKLLGEKIGRALKGGEYIELVGDVGAGKTTLTKGIALGLGISETVQSPTFTINRTYDTPGGLRLSHYDFYRLSDAGIMADELAESLSEPSTVIVIEWGDVVAVVLPSDHMRIVFDSPQELVRSLDITTTGEKSSRLLEKIS